MTGLEKERRLIYNRHDDITLRITRSAVGLCRIRSIKPTTPRPRLMSTLDSNNRLIISTGQTNKHQRPMALWQKNNTSDYAIAEQITFFLSFFK